MVNAIRQANKTSNQKSNLFSALYKVCKKRQKTKTKYAEITIHLQ